jgi:hypothetical protein
MTGAASISAGHHFAFVRTLNLGVSATGGFFLTPAGFEGSDFGGFFSEVGWPSLR